MAGIDFAVYAIPDAAAPHFERAGTADPKVIHRASTRGHVNKVNLQSYRTFSYAGFHDPSRNGFGSLRVLNQETVSPGMAIAPHLHRDMEIVSIPLEGAIEHNDSLGNNTILRPGDIQVMSAGTGLTYYQRNARRDRLAKFLHVWVCPSRKSTAPRYAHIRLDEAAMENGLVPVVAPEGSGAGAPIGQQAWFYMGRLGSGYEFRHRVRSRRNGVYLFLIKGEARVNGETLHSHDGMGLWDNRCIDIRAHAPSQVLLIEVPMP